MSHGHLLLRLCAEAQALASRRQLTLSQLFVGVWNTSKQANLPSSLPPRPKDAKIEVKLSVPTETLEEIEREIVETDMTASMLIRRAYDAARSLLHSIE